MSINSICSDFGNQRTSLFSNGGRGGGVKKSLNGKKGHDVWDFSLAYPLEGAEKELHNKDYSIQHISCKINDNL